ncbi:MAG: hypothetical protein OXI61_09005 [Candidatus Poribacteria bacterium]|nr:hypothetical protein [Candidatus Poribacteria bacterium]
MIALNNPIALAMGQTRVIRAFASGFYLKNSDKMWYNYSIRWQTYEALPLGGVSASHSLGDKRTIHDIP